MLCACLRSQQALARLHHPGQHLLRLGISCGVLTCRYDDAYVYQNVFGPLLKLEADYDKSLKQSQARDNVGIRWDMGLNKKHLARFVFSRDDSELRVVPGDELKLKHVLPGESGLTCRLSLPLRLRKACFAKQHVCQGREQPADRGHPALLTLGSSWQ